MERTSLHFLLNPAGRYWRGVRDTRVWAIPLALLLCRRPVIATVIVILVHIHLASRWFIHWSWLRWRWWCPLIFLRSCRGGGRRLCDCMHWWQCRGMMGGFRWMVGRGRPLLVRSSKFRWAAIRRRPCCFGWRSAMHLDIVQARTRLVRRRLLHCVGVFVPFARPFRRRST